MHRAELYKNHNDFQVNDAKKRIEEYKTKLNLKQNARVIDIGCGDGFVTAVILKKHLPNNYETIIGCDVSTNMIDIANKDFADERTYFKVLDIDDDLPNDMKGRFDHLFGFNLLNWVKDQRKVISNFYDLLQEGGTCLLTVVSYAPLFDMYRILAHRPRWSPLLKDHERYITPYFYEKEPEKVLEEKLRGAGFKSVETRNENISHVFENWESLKGAILAVMAIPLPDDLLDDFMQDLMDLARDLVVLDRAHNNYESGKIVVHHTEVIAFATK